MFDQGGELSQSVLLFFLHTCLLVLNLSGLNLIHVRLLVTVSAYTRAGRIGLPH